jgi:hypothetical protein
MLWRTASPADHFKAWLLFCTAMLREATGRAAWRGRGRVTEARGT